MDGKLLPVGEPTPEVVTTDVPEVVLRGIPSPKQQQWGVLISIVVIVLMVTIGAFYAWGKRIAEENNILAPAAVQ
ncbi:MAG: hypothetical protein WCT45_02010 [Candidatus Paceibacterota bacterium]|jgi:hypothetical protein